MKINLRPYQDKVVEELRRAYANGYKAPIAVLPTGAGKTFIFSYITKLTVEKNFKVLILTHREELWQQASDSLEALGIEHGIIAPRFGQTVDDVKVASVQTLVRRLENTQFSPNLIIIDEAHHAVPNNTWGKVVQYYPNARLLGVTATPSRLDGSGLGVKCGGLFDYMCIGPQMKELQNLGFLSEYDYYCPPTDIDLNDVKTSQGDYAKGELGRAMDKPVIIGSAVEHYSRICPRAPAIAFCASVAHAEHTAEQFKAAGYRALSIDGTMDKNTRKSAIKALGSGRLDVLTSCDIISEGTDIPVVTCAILLRPTQSLGLYFQQVGRVLRPAPGKNKAVILDHVGNVERHGLPNQNMEWELNSTKRIKRKKKNDDELEAIKLKVCEKCYSPFKPAPACPICGHQNEAGKRELKEKSGELKKIDEVKQKAIKARRAEQGKARGLSDLIKLARKKGYKDNWARNIYKSRGNKLNEMQWQRALAEANL